MMTSPYLQDLKDAGLPVHRVSTTEEGMEIWWRVKPSPEQVAQSREIVPAAYKPHDRT